MKKNEGIDGLFCGSDVIAAEAIQAAVELGVSIPDRLRDAIAGAKSGETRCSGRVC